jgi:hypothetical protein
MSAEVKFTLAMRQDKHACFNLTKKMAAAANAKGLYEYVVNETPTPLYAKPSGAVTEANAAKNMADTAKYRDQQEKVGALTFQIMGMMAENVIEMIVIMMKLDLSVTLDCRDLYQGFLKTFCALTDEQYAQHLELLRKPWKPGMSVGKHIMEHMNVRSILNLARPAHSQDMQIQEMLHSLRELGKPGSMGGVILKQIAQDFSKIDGIEDGAKFRTYCTLVVTADEERQFGDMSPLAGMIEVEKVKVVDDSKTITDTQMMIEAINKLVAVTTNAIASNAMKGAAGESDRSIRTLRKQKLAAEMQEKYGNGKYPTAAPCPAHPGNAKNPCTHTWGECKLFLFSPTVGKKK